MSFLTANSPFEDYRQKWESAKGLRPADQVCSASNFLFRLRVQLRYGEFTRAPLRLMRLEILADSVACDWLARPPDAWDADLPRSVASRHASLQALHDAIDMRSLVFTAFPGVETAHLRAYRDLPEKVPEVIVAGCVQRNDNSSRWLHSLVMRARVLGFRFRMEDNILCELPRGDKPLPAMDF
jgi:hypothetical protein